MSINGFMLYDGFHAVVASYSIRWAVWTKTRHITSLNPTSPHHYHITLLKRKNIVLSD